MDKVDWEVVYHERRIETGAAGIRSLLLFQHFGTVFVERMGRYFQQVLIFPFQRHSDWKSTRCRVCVVIWILMLVDL